MTLTKVWRKVSKWSDNLQFEMASRKVGDLAPPPATKRRSGRYLRGGQERISVHSLFHERCSHGNSGCVVNGQDGDRCSPHRSIAVQPGADPVKVLVPTVQPRIKHPLNFPGVWIDSGKVRSFASVTGKTGKRQ